MGAGKSTVGRRLAARLRLPFVDSDAEIEAVTGFSVAEMFDRYGEDSFRDGEKRVVRRLLDGGPQVIATGGGVFINEETRALILARAIAVWLDAPLDVLAERVGRRATRPLVRNSDPATVLARLAAARNPVYAEAHLHVRSETMPHGRTVEAIVEALNRHLAAA